MRRKYKLIVIVVTSVIFAYFIYNSIKSNKINLLSIGDGTSNGITYNFYLKNYYTSLGLLKNYNDNYSKKNYKLYDLLMDIDNNKKVNKEHILQIIHKSNLVTISIGEEELSDLKILNDLDLNRIDLFIDNYDKLLNKIREVNDSKIIIIGFYENKNLNNTYVILLNSKLSNIANKYNSIFINISDLKSSDIYLNIEDEKIIFNRIIDSI